jgi:hypothetical protein
MNTPVSDPPPKSAQLKVYSTGWYRGGLGHSRFRLEAYRIGIVEYTGHKPSQTMRSASWDQGLQHFQPNTINFRSDGRFKQK